MLKQLAQAGVRVWLYLEDRERTLASPTDKLLMSVTAFADELEREKARQRTYNALARKARAGQVTGGGVFGYRNRAVVGTDWRRQYVEREIAPEEAAVVLRIFEPSASGGGVRRITIVREILYRDLYRGVVVWNWIRKRDVWGLKRDLSRLEREIRHRLADWRAMLRREIAEAREILRNLIIRQIIFPPWHETRLYDSPDGGRGCWPGRPFRFRW